MTNQEVVRSYARAAAEGDLATMAHLRHPDWTVEWPQTGERVRGSANYAAVVQSYPGGQPKTRVTRIAGSEDRWILTPANTVVRMAGEGQAWWAEWAMTYPDGSNWHCIELIELRDGTIYRETVYWAPPLPAPAWRAAWVERIEEGKA
jgi:ketosteroid isomerase-like protein